MSMEPIDKLKIAWQDLEGDSRLEKHELSEELLRQWKRRGRRLVAKLVLELTVCAVIYAVAVVVILNAGTDITSQLFGFKIILLSLIFFTPVGVSLYQSLNSLKKLDFSQPMISYVDDAMRKLSRAKRLYERYTFLFSGFMMVLLLTDDYFMDQPTWLKLSTLLFVALAALLIRPYLKLAYGNDLRHFSQLREEMRQTE